MLGNDDLIIQRHHRGSEGIPAGIAQAKHILTLFQHKAGIFFSITGQTAQIKAQRHRFRFAGVQQRRFFKGRQLLIFLVQLPFRSGNIELHHFLTGIAFAHIGHLRLQDHFPAPNLGAHILDGKIRVAKAKTKGECRLHTETVKIAVADIDAFLIVFLLEIAV